MRKELSGWSVFAVIAPALAAAPAYAVQYLTLEQAQQLMFPGASRFVSQPVRLNAEHQRLVEQYAAVKMRTSEQPVWRVEVGGKLLGWFVTDEVFGKHEFITYAVALSADGTLRGVEILDYRETHGGEVRDARWRAQFNGKRYGDTLKLDADIQNISGATLSCKHITEGVRRILALHQTVLR